MENEMVERVASAIYETKTDSEFVGAGAGPEHDLAFDLARAAIEAMREPTEAMAKGWFEAVELEDVFPDFSLSPKLWRAAIDAALSPATSGRTDQTADPPTGAQPPPRR